MTKIDELHIILQLIKKHDLPLSPILEYAIQEREDQYLLEQPLTGDNILFCEPQSNILRSKDLDDYVQDFANMSVGSSKGKKLPHKAILLLGIMHLIESHILIENKFPLEKVIAEAFDLYWQKFVPSTKTPSVWTPFYHLKGEKFWHFKAADTEERLQMLLSFGGTPSVGKMRPVIKYAYLDEALFAIMREEKSRTILQNVLIDKYL